jgi:phosphoglycolate phosphatase
MPTAPIQSTSLIVFDLDGTLIDSRRDIAESANEVLRQYGHPPHPEEAIARMVGEGAAVLIARAFAAAGTSAPPGALDRFLMVYGSRLLRFTRPYPGIPELLAGLDGRVAMAVLTNKPHEPASSILHDLGLSRFFATRVLGGDGHLARKPAPDGLLQLIADADATAASTLMVGDSVVDVQTARAAGTRACLATYGFGFTQSAAEALVEGDATLERPLDLLLWL